MSSKYKIIKISLLTAVIAIGVAGTFVVFAAPDLVNIAYADQDNDASGSTSFNELAAATDGSSCGFVCAPYHGIHP